MGTCPLSGVRFLLGGFLQGFPLFPTGVMLLPGFIRQARVRRPRLLPSPGGIDGFPVRHPSGSPAGDGNPKYILSKRQNRPRENRADGRKGGDGRKCADLAGPRERRVKAVARVCATLCRPWRDAVRTDAVPASSGRGGSLAKRQAGFARGRPPTRREKRPQPRFFAFFHTSVDLFAARNFRLCGKKEISFSKEIPFLPHENGRYGGEMLHTDGFPVRFLTVRGLFASFRPSMETRDWAEGLPF